MNKRNKYIIGILIVLGIFTTVAGLAQVGASIYTTDDGLNLLMKSGHIEDGDYVCYDAGSHEINTIVLNVWGTDYQVDYFMIGTSGRIVSVTPIEPEEDDGSGEVITEPEEQSGSDEPVEPETLTTPGSIYDVGGVYLQLAQGSLESGQYTYYEDDGSYDTLFKTAIVMGNMYVFKYAITEYGIGKIVDIFNDDDTGRAQPLPIEKYGQSYSLGGYDAWLQSGSIESNEFTLFEDDGTLVTLTKMAFFGGVIYTFDYTVDQYGVARIVGISPDNRVVDEPEEVVNNTTDDTNPQDVGPDEPETVGKIYNYTGGLCQLLAGSFEEGNYICYPEDLSQPFNIGAIVCDGHQYIVKVMYTESSRVGRICAVLNEVNNTTDVDPEQGYVDPSEDPREPTEPLTPEVNNTTDVEPENITNDTEGKDIDEPGYVPSDEPSDVPSDGPADDPEDIDPIQPPLVPEDEPYSDPDRREQSVTPVIDSGANATADVDEIESTNQNSTPAPDNDNKIVMQKTGTGIILAILAVIAILGAVVYIRR